MGMGGHWLCEKKTGGEEIQNQFGEGAAALKENGEAKSWPAAWFFFCVGRSEKIKRCGGRRRLVYLCQWEWGSSLGRMRAVRFFFLEEKGASGGLGCRPFICWLKGKKMGGNGLELVRGSVCARLETRKRRPTGGAELLIFS